MRFGRRRISQAIAFVLPLCCAEAQVRYSSGQNVAPVYEGWETNPDGSFNMVFGYMNRNYEERVEVPVGPDNRIEPSGIDQGQPAYFYPRRQEFVFKVRVPKDWGEKDLIWTLKSHGKEEKAYGSLLPVWELNTLVYLENRRGASALTYPEEPNKAPSIEMVGSSQKTAVVGVPITLTVKVTDDGYPTPSRRRARGSQDGNRISSIGFRILRRKLARSLREPPVRSHVVPATPQRHDPQEKTLRD